VLGKLVRPDINTKFRVDYDGWAERNGNIRMLIREQLCAECKAKFGSDATAQDIDWVDPSTGEVTVVDGLRYALRDCCSRKEDYISRSTPLTAAIFRALIADDGTPLSATEIHQRIGRSDPKTLLRILLGEGMRTHYGVRPILG